MDNNKRIALSLAIVAIIAVAAIGIGYAYTASTINSGNTATSEYLTLVQGENGAYTFTTNGYSEVKWNTVDGKNTSGNPVAITNFKLESPIADDNDSKTPFGDYSLQQVGEDFTIIATSTNTTVSSQTCSITPSNTGFNTEIGNSKAVYFLRVVVNSTTPVTTFFKYDNGAFKEWNSSNSVSDVTSFTITTSDNKAFDTTTVSVYYGYQGTDGINVTHAAGTPPEGPSTAQTQPLANASLTFAINPVTTSA